MATDIEKLVVQLSADFKSFEKSLARQQGVANKQFNAIERRALQMNKKLDGIFSRSFNGLKAGVAGVGAALGVNELRKLTDTWTDLTSRVNLAVGSQEKGVEVMDRLGTMARRTYSDLSLTTESYLANSTALQELGYSTDQSLDYTEALNNALVVSGAKGDKAARVQDALAKAMGLGKLQGQNLNTILADGGRVAEALAAGLGTTVGGLRKLGAEGKITGRVMVDALSSQMEKLRKEAESMPATIGDGFTLLNNALLEYVGNADSATGVSAKIADALIIIADNFDKVADAGLQVAAILAGVLVGRSLAQMIRTLGLAGTALKSFLSTLAAARTMGGLATAFGGLSAAAGPVGMVIGGAVVGSLAMYSSHTSDAIRKSEAFEKELVSLGLLAKKSASGIDDAADSIIKLGDAQAAQKIRSIADEIERLRTGGKFGGAGDELNALQTDARGSLWDDKADAAAKKEISELITLLQTTQITAGEVRKRMDALRTTPVSDSVKELADDLDRTAAKMEALNARASQLGAMPELDAAKEQLNAVIDDLDRLEKREIITSEQRRNLEDALTKLRDTGEGADDARTALATLGSLSFSTTLIGLDSLIGKVSVLYQEAEKASGAMARAAGQGSSSFSRGGRTRARQTMIEERELNSEYVSSAKQRAALGKAQYDLEAKIAQVRAQSIKDGRKLTEAQIKEIAAAQLAGDAARSAEGKKPKKEKAPKKTEDDYFFQITQQVKDRTAALAEEAKITGLTFVEQEKRRTALELEQDVLSRLREEARKKGDKDWENIKLTPEQVSSIDAVSEAYARQADELRKIQEAQSDAERAAAEFADTIKSGFVDAVTGASSLQDALSGILKKLAEMILNSAFDKLFNGATASGGWLTGAMKAIGFADGGYTGAGGVNQPAGVVHKGEVVWSQKDVARAGGVAAVEAMRRGMRGYSAGGAVAMPALKAPTMPVLKAQPAGGGSVSAPVSIQIDARGADNEGLARLEKQLARMQSELPSRVIQTIRKAQNSNVSLG
ncbi:tape measure protein [Paenochrobactrum pullorum]|uniref:tape measure protein n=1 Tax=Paenochrobactrum pullorum TaxID=1324351 RepID=UPI0035BBAE75